MVGLDVAEARDLGADGLVDLVVGAAHDEVGLDAHGAQLAHGVLRGLGLDLVGGGDVGHEAHVDEAAVGSALLLAELADGLDERLALDVADGAAELGDDHVCARLLLDAAEALLDGVRDVRDDLDGAAEEVSAALAGDEALVDGARGEVGVAREVLVNEALVVAEVQVGLVAVLGHEDLAVLERAHRARVDVEVGIGLLHHDLVATRFEQAAERGGGDALAKGRDDATSHEDVLCHARKPSRRDQRTLLSTGLHPSTAAGPGRTLHIILTMAAIGDGFLWQAAIGDAAIGDGFLWHARPHARGRARETRPLWHYASR